MSGLPAHAGEILELDGVSVSLSVTDERSVGVATVGTEASIEVSFKPRGEAA